MGKNPFPSIFYVYGNKTYEEDIKAYLSAHFNTSALNLSSSTGCGFKIESYDVGDLKNLDIELEKYEGWIQQTRRTEFNDLETNLLDLDKFIAGCDNRISTDDRNYANFAIKAHLPSVVCIRSLNYLGSGVAGDYTIYMGGVTIKNAVPINTSVTDNRIYRKTLLNTHDFDLQVSNCTLNNALIEFKGKENTSEWTYDNPFPPNTPIPSEMIDKSLTTFKVIPWDNYPRCVINHALGFVKAWSIYIEISGTSGDTYKFEPANCYAYNANTFTIEKDLYPDFNAQHPILSENTGYSFYIPVDKNITQLRFSLQSVEHPYPAFPAPLPDFRFYEMIIKNA
jgi:hypothetical protein